jgi:hypothetical protein
MRQTHQYDYCLSIAIKYYRAAIQLVPDIEFRMAHKATSQQMTTVNFQHRT